MIMKVVIKEVGNAPQVKDIENKLDVIQGIVGGYIEVVRVAEDILLICNEEGKLQGLPPNFGVGHDVIVGTALFVGFDGSEDFAGLSDEQIERIKMMFS